MTQDTFAFIYSWLSNFEVNLNLQELSPGIPVLFVETVFSVITLLSKLSYKSVEIFIQILGSPAAMNLYQRLMQYLNSLRPKIGGLQRKNSLGDLGWCITALGDIATRMPIKVTALQAPGGYNVFNQNFPEFSLTAEGSDGDLSNVRVWGSNGNSGDNGNSGTKENKEDIWGARGMDENGFGSLGNQKVQSESSSMSDDN